MDKVTLQLSKFKAANRLTQADHPKIRPKTVHFVQVWGEVSLRLLVVQSLPRNVNATALLVPQVEPGDPLPVGGWVLLPPQRGVGGLAEL